MMMTIKHNVIVIGVSVVIALSIPFIYLNGHKKIGYKTFQTSAGWGYDILINKKLFIHQEYIPVIAEKRGFSSKGTAIKAACLVIDKIKNNKPPTLIKGEVDHICRE